MTRSVITGEEGEELKRLYGEHEAAVRVAGEALRLHGMESREFFDADSAAGRLYSRIREILGTAHQHWMV